MARAGGGRRNEQLKRAGKVGGHSDEVGGSVAARGTGSRQREASRRRAMLLDRGFRLPRGGPK